MAAVPSMLRAEKTQCCVNIDDTLATYRNDFPIARQTKFPKEFQVWKPKWRDIPTSDSELPNAPSIALTHVGMHGSFQMSVSCFESCAPFQWQAMNVREVLVSFVVWRHKREQWWEKIAQLAWPCYILSSACLLIWLPSSIALQAST